MDQVRMQRTYSRSWLRSDLRVSLTDSWFLRLQPLPYCHWRGVVRGGTLRMVLILW